MRILIYAASLAIGLVLGTLIFRNVPGLGALIPCHVLRAIVRFYHGDAIFYRAHERA